jgi:hypothetical protein
MDFNDFFENKRQHQENYKDYRFYDEDRYSHDIQTSATRQREPVNWVTILEKIRTNKKTRTWAVSGIILVFATAILLIIIFMPLIMQLLNYINQNGISGIAEGISAFLGKIWKGQ